ncbi:uncharacterized protein LOC143195157 [Rhynchophorus ferrugineus]|uniref:uncharacterized protein LOC143195157 n=1 Tax=Rhynchophorus ferrugineus TaxID=354439 RepID=UPI003FCE2B6C
MAFNLSAYVCTFLLFLILNKINYILGENSTSLHYEYVLLEDEHPCRRTCVSNASPMICRYTFQVENYYTMTKACHDCPRNVTDCFRKDCIPGDGHERAVVVVNRKLPGPTIEVCRDDIVIVDVQNHLMSESTTIHWHGQHQKETPYMDGVPFVTQCPILPRNTFRYIFKASQAGTHLWHSHIGMQRVDGCFGPLIVRVPPDENSVKQFYDYDLQSHVITLIDWEKMTATEKFLYHHHSVGDNKPSTLLVNGLGRHRIFDNTDINGTYHTPLARFRVEQGYRYRFRLINAGYLNCPIEVSVDNHTIKVISTDGNDVIPVEAESLVTYAGERFDFVLNADQPKSLYWIRFRGLMDCDERFNRAHQVAVLEYEGFEDYEGDIASPRAEYEEPSHTSAPSTLYNLEDNTTDVDYEYNTTTVEPSTILNILNTQPNVIYSISEPLPEGDPNYDNSRRTGRQINALNRGTESGTDYISMPQIVSLNEWDSSLKTKPDVQIYLAYDFYNLNNTKFHRPGYEFYNVKPVTNQLQTPQLNHISMEMPSFPLLPQRDQVPEDMFCNNETVKENDCVNNYCECHHGYEIPLNAVVELVIIDEGFAYDANHPLHLHGYAFRVVAMERVGRNITVQQVKDRDRAGLVKRNLLNPPIKDTVTVPDGGYTIVRFHATNPGYWIFHCHIEFHAEIGMALVFRVGKNSQMLPVPEGFPRCGSYLPEEYEYMQNENSTIEGPSDNKPLCSKNNFINKFEKVLFGDYCLDPVASSASIITFSACILLTLFNIFF